MESGVFGMSWAKRDAFNMVAWFAGDARSAGELAEGLDQQRIFPLSKLGRTPAGTATVGVSVSCLRDFRACRCAATGVHDQEGAETWLSASAAHLTRGSMSLFGCRTESHHSNCPEACRSATIQYMDQVVMCLW